MPPKKIENYTDEELDAKLIELGNERDKIKKEMRELTAESDKRFAQAEAKRKLELMSDTEKAALHQMIQTEGISSEEQVGRVG